MIKTTAYMATFPGREIPLADAVNSLKGQVDKIVLWVNNYPKDKRNQFEQNLKGVDNLKIVYSDIYAKGEDGNIGDIGKFYFMDEWKGYVFTVDDTWIYPPNYVAYMKSKIEQYKHKAVITIHGRSFTDKIKSYYFHKEVVNLYNTTTTDQLTANIGTGVMALHSDVLKGCPISLSEFRHTNMTDIYFGIALQKRAIPQIVVAHEGLWVKSNPRSKGLPRISETCYRNEQLQIDVVNAFNWKLTPVQ